MSRDGTAGRRSEGRTRLALPAPGDLEAVEPAGLPAVLAHLAALQAVVAARMAQVTTETITTATEDKLLSIPEAAKRMGMSADYLYRRPELPFVRRIGKRSLRVSSAALDRWLANRGRGR